jgi:hypothetical protein
MPDYSDFEKYIIRRTSSYHPRQNADGTPTTLRPTSNLTPEHLSEIPGLYYDDSWTALVGGKTTAAA